MVDGCDLFMETGVGHRVDDIDIVEDGDGQADDKRFVSPRSTICTRAVIQRTSTELWKL